MPSVEFESTILAGERPYTYALNRSATGTGKRKVFQPLILVVTLCSLDNVNNGKMSSIMQIAELFPVKVANKTVRSTSCSK